MRRLQDCSVIANDNSLMDLLPLVSDFNCIGFPFVFWGRVTVYSELNCYQDRWIRFGDFDANEVLLRVNK